MSEAKCIFSRILLLFKLWTSLYTKFFLYPHQYILLSFSRGIHHLLHLSRKNGSHHFQQLSYGTLSIPNQSWHRGWVQTEHPSKPCTISLPPHPNLQKSSKMLILQLIYAKPWALPSKVLEPVLQKQQVPEESVRMIRQETPWSQQTDTHVGRDFRRFSRSSKVTRFAKLQDKREQERQIHWMGLQGYKEMLISLPMEPPLMTSTNAYTWVYVYTWMEMTGENKKQRGS